MIAYALSVDGNLGSQLKMAFTLTCYGYLVKSFHTHTHVYLDSVAKRDIKVYIVKKS